MGKQALPTGGPRERALLLGVELRGTDSILSLDSSLKELALLEPTPQFRCRDDLFFAGQLTGVEGYLGNIATGLLAGVNAARVADGGEPMTLPEETMLGALCHYITHADSKNFQPMKANFGILPPLPPGKRLNRRDRAHARAERAKASLREVWPAQREELRIGNI